VSLGLSILSWRGAETLSRSLESYAQADLFSIFDEAQVFLPEPDDAVLSLVKAYDVMVRTSPQNLGIMENMALSVASMTTDYVLMLENDCPLIESKDEVERQLLKSLELLKNEDVIMARLRSISSPGQNFTGLEKYRRLYDGSFSSHVVKTMRPDKLRRLTGYALYDGIQSIRRHPEHFQNMGDRFFLINAEVMPWTNQSILIHRKTFLNRIIPLARSIKTRRHANNLPNLEIELNKSNSWKNSGWKIACGPGLFTHERIGNRGYA